MNIKNKFPILYYHQRLVSGIIIGIISWFLLPETLRETRLLIAFDIGVICYLFLIFKMIFHFSKNKKPPRSMQENEGSAVILALTILASIISLSAIVVELSGSSHLQGSIRYFHIGLTIITIVLSWFLMHTMFALHYAHLYYLDIKNHHPPCIIFPEEQPQPDYLDFIYFSFIIGTSAQTADILFASPKSRRIGIVHAILAFFYNTAILALMINIAASLIDM